MLGDRLAHAGDGIDDLPLVDGQVEGLANRTSERGLCWPFGKVGRQLRE